MSISALRRAAMRVGVYATTLLVPVAGLGVLSAPAQAAEAANPVTPRSFSGYGFDQCRTPSQQAMDAWLYSSPYWAVGVYIAGDNRACGDAVQTELTADWVRTQLRHGWRILPITVGPQAPCYVNPRKKDRIAADPSRDYAEARAQGRVEARDTVARARALGIVPRSTLWYDIEAFDTDNVRCREATLHFLSAWTRTLHKLGYVSGVYGSAARGINALDDARVEQPRHLTMPDQIWVAEWVDAEDYRTPPTANPPSLYSRYFRDDGWLPGGRMRQYRGGHDETHGGVTINIDTNYLHLGRGTRPGRAGRSCGGIRIDFLHYRRLRFQDRGAQVRGLQCLLDRKGFYGGKVRGYYNKVTVRAVKRFQRSRDLRASGRVRPRTWTALLSANPRTPVVKIGSGGPAVRRVQRALNAAIGAELAVDGIFGPSTTRAVRRYQREVGVPGTGVVNPWTWRHLHAGHR